MKSVNKIIERNFFIDVFLKIKILNLSLNSEIIIEKKESKLICFALQQN